MRKWRYLLAMQAALAAIVIMGGYSTAAAEQVTTQTVHVEEEQYVISASVDAPENRENMLVSPLFASSEQTVDMEAASRLLLSVEERQRAVRRTHENTCYNRANTLYATQSIQVENNGTLEIDLYSYPGHFSYRRSVPSSFIRTNDWNDNSIYAQDGVAKQCSLTADEAKLRADQLLSELSLPFDYRWYDTRAYSPAEDTYYTVGYYDVIYQELIDGMPLAVNNVSPQGSYDRGVAYKPENFYGIMIRVFDSGIYSLSCEWFDSFEPKGQQVPLLSLDEAITQLSSYFSQNPGLDITPMPMRMEHILLEYAVSTEDGQRYVLIPSWSFLCEGSRQAFDGLRVNAIDGEILLFNGWVL